VADLFENMSVESFGEKQDAFLLEGWTKQPAFAEISEDGLIAATLAAETRKTSMQVSAIQILAHHLADNGAPAAILLDGVFGCHCFSVLIDSIGVVDKKAFQILV
jgi:hypothetical protein